jgi:hypothetical protein
MADCFECRTKLGWNAQKVSGKDMKKVQQMVGFSDEFLDKMNDKDVLCMDCNEKFGLRHALEMYNYNKKNIPEKDWETYLKHPDTISIVQEAERLLAEQSSTGTGSSVDPSGATPSTGGDAIPVSNTTVSTSNTTPTIQNTLNVTSSDELRAITASRHNEFKAQWDKNGIVQFKNNKIAILKRVVGQQVQFIVAYDKVTEEGYRLMAIDEGITASGSGFSGGASAFFYFQKMEFVR